MSQQMPKLSDLLQNLRIPEKQVEGMMKEAGITPPSGPAKMLVQQAESFEEKGVPFEGEFPFPNGRKRSSHTNGKGRNSRTTRIPYARATND